MPTKEELLEAIKEIESRPSSYENCQRLVVFYNLYDRYYANKRINRENIDNMQSFDYKKDSRFLKLAKSTSNDNLYAVMDELMDCLKLVNKKLYESVLSKLEEA